MSIEAEWHPSENTYVEVIEPPIKEMASDAGDHVKNFFCDAVIDFLNPSYSVNQPKEENVREFPEEDRSSWDVSSALDMNKLQHQLI